MPDTEKPAGSAQPVIDRAFLEANHRELVSEFKAEAATAERKRILAIQALDGPEEIIAACVEDAEVGAGEAALRILEAKREREKARAKAHLKERADTEQGLEAPAPSAHSESAVTDERARAKRLVALYRQLKGHSAPASA